MPIADVHLYASDHVYDIAIRGNAQTVFILSATAVFIIIISILNFVNLSTARAINRVKEVGVRKVVGAFRMQLVYQFISESVMVTLVALILGGLMVELILPGLNSFTEKSIPTDIFLNPVMILILIGSALVMGIAAGAYPAFYISAFKPAHILTNKNSGRSGKNLLRQGLVVLQFILSFFLIMASLIVSEQHHYMRTTDMGFNKENVLVVRLRGEMNTNLETTKAIFSSHPNILSATAGYGLPGEAYAGDGFIDERTKKDVSCSMLLVDHDYIKTLGIEMVAGRDFSKDFAADATGAFVVSEATTRLLGYMNPADALEHPISWNRWDAPDTLKKGKVIGVVKDFHLNSLKEHLSPVLLQIYPFAYTSISFRVKAENMEETIAHLERSWKQFNSEWPFEYKFLDENFDQLYKGEEKLATLFTFFTGFTIFVACLGLFGLVVYTTSQKYKEISIRKVMGAEDIGLVLQLSKSYLLLIILAFLIAAPFSFFVAEQWLSRFAFRIEITAWIFVKAGLLIATIALLTVGIQSFNAARRNPVDALKES
jgi:putative ABC transport system permease protein